MLRITFLLFLPVFFITLKAAPVAEKMNNLLGDQFFPQDNAWGFADFRKRVRIKFDGNGGRFFTSYSKTTAGVTPKEIICFTDREEKFVRRITFTFANRGDDTRRTSSLITDAKRNLKRNISAVCGPAKRRNIDFLPYRKQADFWQAGSAGIYLEADKNEYVQLHIVTDMNTTPEDDQRDFDYSKNVVNNDFGDVYIPNVPMVDQGDKGYCVPATMARVFQYYGVNLDIHYLAKKGNSDPDSDKGGTNPDKLKKSIASVRRHSGLTYSEFSNLSISKIANYIDKGYPVIWSIWSTENLNKVYAFSMENREKYTDPEKWRKVLKSVKISGKHNHNEGHYILIIGYNNITGEIALSNSWGKGYIKPIWIPMKVAKAVYKGPFFIIHP